MLVIFLVLSLTSPSLGKGSIQTPSLMSCSRTQQVQLGGVTIENAKIGLTMFANFTLKVSEKLGSEPKLKLTVKEKGGIVVPCINDVGSCTYKLCGGTSSMEHELGKPWNNVCPVPKATFTHSLKAKLNPLIQFVIGFAPATLTVQLKVTNGGSTVVCQMFHVKIDKA